MSSSCAGDNRTFIDVSMIRPARCDKPFALPFGRVLRSVMHEEDRYIASKDFCAKFAGEEFCSEFAKAIDNTHRFFTKTCDALLPDQRRAILGRGRVRREIQECSHAARMSKQQRRDKRSNKQTIKQTRDAQRDLIIGNDRVVILIVA